MTRDITTIGIFISLYNILDPILFAKYKYHILVLFGTMLILRIIIEFKGE